MRIIVSSGLEQEQVAGSSDNGAKSSGSIKCEECLDWLST